MPDKSPFTVISRLAMFGYQRVFKIVAEYCCSAAMVLSTSHLWKLVRRPKQAQHLAEVNFFHQIFMIFHDISLHLKGFGETILEKKTQHTCWMPQPVVARFHLSFRPALLLPLRAAPGLRHRQRRRKRRRRRFQRRRAAQQQSHAGGEESHLERQENLAGFHHGLD